MSGARLTDVGPAPLPPPQQQDGLQAQAWTTALPAERTCERAHKLALPLPDRLEPVDAPAKHLHVGAVPAGQAGITVG